MECPDNVLRKAGKEISLCVYELCKLADSRHSNLNELLKSLGFVPDSNLIVSVDEAIRFTEEVYIGIPPIIEKGVFL